MAARSRVRQYNVAEAKARLSDLLRQALRGEEVVIARDHKPLVKLVPVRTGRRKPGSAKGVIAIADDFNKTPDDFVDYM